MSELLKHAIPGYGLHALYRSVTSDDPFPIKVRDSVLASTSLGFHYILTTHHASKMMAHRIGTHGHSSHRTHGWGITRQLIKATPVVATTAIAIGVESLAIEEIVSNESVPTSDKIRMLQGISY